MSAEKAGKSIFAECAAQLGNGLRGAIAALNPGPVAVTPFDPEPPGIIAQRRHRGEAIEIAAPGCLDATRQGVHAIGRQQPDQLG
jgi:hypothetical protein